MSGESGLRLYRCMDGTVISILFLCDEIHHCQSSEDENTCDYSFLSVPTRICNMIRSNNIELLLDICPILSLSLADLNKFAHHVTPCIFEAYNFTANSSHLLDCDGFNCTSDYYKCPEEYCIPWRFVCNGVWECPGGMEEKQCHHHGCPAKFSCINSQICLSISSINDLMYDCPFGDDEYFHFPLLPECYSGCKCLLYSLYCNLLLLRVGVFVGDPPGGGG